MNEAGDSTATSAAATHGSDEGQTRRTRDAVSVAVASGLSITAAGAKVVGDLFAHGIADGREGAAEGVERGYSLAVEPQLLDQLLTVKEAVHQFRQGRAVALPARRAAGIKIVPLFLEQGEGILPVFPRPEIMQLSLIFLHHWPLRCAVRGNPL